MTIEVTMRYLHFIFILLFSFTSHADEPVILSTMKIQPSATATHITFILNKKTPGRVKYLPNTKQLIVEFSNTQKHFTMHNARLGGANVVSIDSKDLPNNGIQFIFSVRDKIRWSIHFLTNEKTQNTELQLDIISLVPKSPHTSPSAPSSLTSRGLTAGSSHHAGSRAFARDVSGSGADRSVKSKPYVKINAQVAHSLEDDIFKMLAEQATENQTKKRLFTVVIDAGHGGKDVGAKGPSGMQEKTVVLSIAKRLARLINQSANMRAVLTRNGDYFVPLRGRLKLARKDNADLFIAIHADAYFEDNARGASVYALSSGAATSEAARWLAQKDNYSELGGVELNALQDRSPLLRSVLIDLAQTSTTQDSLRLGRHILNALNDISALHYKHVEQAPFMVLRSPDIPSVLIETGFISNPYEEARLSDPRYQQKLAQAIYQGILQMK
jgi:N-acetylmuramoyl-L-alanine amidase